VSNYPDNFSGRACDAYWSDAIPGLRQGDVEAFAAEWGQKVADLLKEAQAAFLKSDLANIGHWQERPCGLEDVAEAAKTYVEDCLLHVAVQIRRMG